MIQQRGITFLELVTVLSLVSIVTATAALRYPEILADWRLDAGARQIVLDLQEIRLRTIAEGVSYRLRFELHEGAYRVQKKEKDRYQDEGPPVRLPPNVTVVGCTAVAKSISFQPRGHAGTFGAVTLANATGKQRLVIVDMVGRARIQ